MEMLSLIHPSTFAYVVLAVTVVFSLPWLLRQALDALRDLRDFRDGY